MGVEGGGGRKLGQGWISVVGKARHRRPTDGERSKNEGWSSIG
jgi:hypothetical protein